MLVQDAQNIRLGMLGMVPENGHPYSWSAIINGGYDPVAMADCGYPAIPKYLGAQPRDQLGIPGCAVTHIWCDDSADARGVARAAMIPNVVDRAEDVIGHVDAVIIATDIGSEHVERARAFFDAGLPVFIDKPLTDNRDGLQQFTDWHRSGKRFMSSSCMRYSKEFIGLRERMHEIGEPRAITVLMAKSWERYGIHALESVYSMLPPGGYEWVANTGDGGANVVHLRHRNGVDVVLITTTDLYGAFGVVQLAGTKGCLEARFTDTFYAFKSQLAAFVSYLRTSMEPLPFEQTREQMAVIIAGIESRDHGGDRVYLKEILS